MKDIVWKYMAGTVTALLGHLMPVAPLIGCAMTCTSIDFVTGILADRQRTRRNGKRWRFQSRKAWKTVKKTAFIMMGICMAWLIDDCIVAFAHLRLANIFTGFVCGVEFWSYLENASEITETPVFSLFKNHLRRSRSRKPTEQ